MKFKAERKAYTLIELLIAMAIMVILLIISIAGFETYDRRNSLILTANSLKSFILNAKADAQSRDSDLWGQGTPTTSTLSLEVQSDGLTINEYRYFNGVQYKSSDGSARIFRSFVVDKKYKSISLSPSSNIIIDSPTGKITSPASLDIVLTLSGDTATIHVTNENIIINRSF